MNEEEIIQLQKDNKFLSEMMLVKFDPSNYSLTDSEQKDLKECYNRAFKKL